jgi:hypothetical protein
LNYALANAAAETSGALVESQIVSRDANASTFLNAVARDVAFQEFSPTLFQANPTTVDEHANVNAVGQDQLQPEAADGLNYPTVPSAVDTNKNSSDAVSREREATNDVLDELEDVDRLMPATVAKDAGTERGAQAEAALADSLSGEAEGGMVLLRATREANVSGFDLTPVYAEHVGRFNLSTKMETSVGMFQAMDVASDDAPLVDVVQPTEQSAQINHDARSEDKLPTKREQSSTNKAAALVGVTTLTGALAWMNRVVSTKPTAQKRRASQR